MKSSRKPILSSLFIAIGMVLPFLTGSIPKIGNMLLPMHIPVFLCGLICGWQYGLTVGLLLPFMRSILFGTPVMYPIAAAMAFELAAYGGISGFLFGRAHWQCVRSLYRCMLAAMLGGRCVWGIAMALLMGIGANGFTFQMFCTGAFLNAVPGIALQLVLIPAVMMTLYRTHLVPMRKGVSDERHKILY